MIRAYQYVVENHLSELTEMVLIAGPRQVGKTTMARDLDPDALYYNWDIEKDRDILLKGGQAITEELGLGETRTVILDGLHKFPQWKNLLKGFYDQNAASGIKIVVTGSTRLDLYQKGADSLMGRYFLYRMHPLTVAEIANPRPRDTLTSGSAPMPEHDLDALLAFGGFPAPFIRRSRRYYNRWRNQRSHLLFREDMRDITNIFQTSQVEVLAGLLRHRAGSLTSYASLAGRLRASEDSIRRWISVLETLYYCYTLRPWTKNLTRSLLKEPKIYLWDWAMVGDPGARLENFVASHLLKAVHFWVDNGFGDFGLYYLRTKDKREVDFIVVRDERPWFLVEVKSSTDRSMNPNLAYFQKELHVPHAFQICRDARYVDQDCFMFNHPVKVPLSTFLSQLF